MIFGYFGLVDCYVGIDLQRILGQSLGKLAIVLDRNLVPDNLLVVNYLAVEKTHSGRMYSFVANGALMPESTFLA